MGAKGDLGIELDLDQVPCRETGMTAYEMMLSESQERMLMVLRPEKEPEAEAIFRKWGLDFAIVGRTTDDLRFRVLHQRQGGSRPADQGTRRPGAALRPAARGAAPPRQPLDPKSIPASGDCGEDLIRILEHAGHEFAALGVGAIRHPHRRRHVERPGGDAGVVRVGDRGKGLAFSLDVTPRYCAADPFEGGKQAVAECWRNLTAVGAEPLAITDNLNFGNPEKPEIMGELVAAIQGIAEACEALAFPVVSGNVSLYNETNGVAIPPTPTIGGVGLVPDVTRIARIGFAGEGEAILLVGAPDNWGTHLGRSVWLRDIAGREEGPPPPVDLAHEKRVGDLVRGLIRDGLATAVHDCSDGGLAVALAEMAMASGIGATVNQLNDVPPAASFFGEDQGRYVVTVRAGRSGARLGAHRQGRLRPVDRQDRRQRAEARRRGRHPYCKARASL